MRSTSKQTQFLAPLAPLLAIACLVALLLQACGDTTSVTSGSKAGSQPSVAMPTAALALATNTSGAVATNPAATTAPVTASSGDVIKIRMTHTAAKDSTFGVMAAKFAQVAQQKSAGRIQVELFPEMSVAGGDLILAAQMLQGGKIEASIHSSLILASINPKLEVFVYPFLFPTRESAYKFIDGDLGKQLVGSLEQYNIKVLGIGEQGFRQLNNNKRVITSPDDMKGLRIRIPPTNLYTKIFKLLGAEPQTVNFSAALYQSFKDKTLDGQENGLGITSLYKFQEVLPYLTMWNYSWDPLFVGFNTKFYDSLPPDIQNILKEASQEAGQAGRLAVQESEATILENFRKQGIQITTLTPAQHQAFVKAVAPIYEDGKTQFGKDYIEKIVQSIQSAP